MLFKRIEVHGKLTCSSIAKYMTPQNLIHILGKKKYRKKTMQ